MVATNHSLTGAVIAASLSHPTAIIVALLSHFVIDALPHFGGASNRIFVIIESADMILLTILFVAVALAGSSHVWLLFACMVAAVAPDIVWLYRIIQERRGLPPKPMWLTRFHKSIQWSETPRGIVFELVWCVSFSFILANLLV